MVEGIEGEKEREKEKVVNMENFGIICFFGSFDFLSLLVFVVKLTLALGTLSNDTRTKILIFFLHEA